MPTVTIIVTKCMLYNIFDWIILIYLVKTLKKNASFSSFYYFRFCQKYYVVSSLQCGVFLLC